MSSINSRLRFIAASPSRGLNLFLKWLFKSQVPFVVYIRELIRRNDFLRLAARFFIRSVRGLPDLVTKSALFLKGPAFRRLHAIIAARAFGGSLTPSELEQIWNVCRRGTRVLYLADGLERKQIEIVLSAAGAELTCYNDLPKDEAQAIRQSTYDILIAAPQEEINNVEDLFEKFQSVGRLRRVGHGNRSKYASYKYAGAVSRTGNAKVPLNELLKRGEPLRVVFLNDMGFQYGAGIALKRQVASLLLLGWEVAVVAWTPGNLDRAPTVAGVLDFPNWLGVHEVWADGLDEVEVQTTNAEVVSKIQSFNPDLVITGNLHGAKWSLEILNVLTQLGIKTVAYMHDAYFITGRCAQPLACTLYQTGCDARCPTPHEYPALAPNKIAEAWENRSQIFTGSHCTPLVGNSRWTRNMVANRFGSAAKVDFVNLGIDHELFAPIEKSLARRLLKIPNNKPLVIMGSVDVHDRWKGGSLFHGLFESLVKRTDVGVILFGRSSEVLSCEKSFGVVQDPGLMPLILSAADIFVSTAIAESFGQTLLEASACALPVVAFDVGGVSDVIVHNETGILVKKLSVEELNAAVKILIEDPDKRQRMGANGRRRVEERFTLYNQAAEWIEYLKRSSQSYLN